MTQEFCRRGVELQAIIRFTAYCYTCTGVETERNVSSNLNIMPPEKAKFGRAESQKGKMEFTT